MKNINLTIFLSIFLVQFAKAQDKNFTIYTYPVEEINSKDPKVEELAPVISGDGEHLFFVRWKDPENKGKLKKQDIWYSKKQGNSWAKPINLGSSINNDDHNVICGTNEDGSIIYLSNEYIYNKKGEFIGMRPGLSYSEKQGCDTCWSKPKSIKIKGLESFNINYDKGATFHYHRIDNGKIILFSAFEKQDESGGKEKENIFVCFQNPKKLDVYENIIKLGKNINDIDGVRRETAPFLSANGQKLYFTSIKKNEQVELYVSEREVDDPYSQDIAHWTSAWKKAKPVYENHNFVDKIHHGNFEAYLFLHRENKLERDIDDYGFLAMDSPANIYEFNFLRHHNLKVEAYEITKDGVEKPLILDKLNLKNTQSKILKPKSIDENAYHYIFLRQPDTLHIPKSVMDKQTESIIINTKNANATFTIEAEKNDYSFVKGEKKWTMTDDKFFKGQNTDVVKLYFEKYSKSEIDSFMVTINFDWDSARVRPMEHEILDTLVSFLNNYEKIQLSIYGHTDNTGRKAKNDTLSLRRVNSTFDALKSKNLNNMTNQSRVVKIPFGENALKNKTVGEVKDEVNRRAEIVIKNFPAEAHDKITELCQKIKAIRTSKKKSYLNEKDCLRVEQYNEEQKSKTTLIEED